MARKFWGLSLVVAAISSLMAAPGRIRRFRGGRGSRFTARDDMGGDVGGGSEVTWAARARSLAPVGVGTLLIAGQGLAGGTASRAIYALVSVGAAGAVFLGIGRHNPPARAGWMLVGVAMLLLASGDLFASFTSEDAVAADALFLAAYCALIAAVLGALKHTLGVTNRTAILDAVIVGTGAATLLGWLLRSIDSASSGIHDVLEVTYATLDVSLIALVTAYLLLARRRGAAVPLLILGFVALLVGDLVNTLYATLGIDQPFAFVGAAWLAAYVLWASAALHPTMRDFGAPHRSLDVVTPKSRFLVLSLAVLGIPVVQITSRFLGGYDNPTAAILVSALVALLVLLRLAEHTRLLRGLTETVQATANDVELMSRTAGIANASDSAARCVEAIADQLVASHRFDAVHIWCPPSPEAPPARACAVSRERYAPLREHEDVGLLPVDHEVARPGKVALASIDLRDFAGTSAFAAAAARTGLRWGTWVSIDGPDGVLGTIVAMSAAGAPEAERTSRLMCFVGEQIGNVIERERALLLLRHTTERAEQADHAKSQFLSRMSHELRTPLTAILGFSQLLQVEGLTHDQQEPVGYISSAGQHLLSLINDVLDIARIESGEMTFSPESVDLITVASECLELVRPMATGGGITLLRIDVGDAVFVKADRSRLKQVLINLLSNAIKYNVSGGKVWVKAQLVEGAVHVSVADTGRGMSPQQLSRLYTPFDRLGAEVSNIEGTGIGLALSQRITEAMGGSITVESEQGNGSTFTLRLPAAAAGPMSKTTKRELPSFEHLNGRVLYIDDNQLNIRLMERILRGSTGLVVATATTGSEGIEAAAKLLPDLIFLDVNLPDLPGIGVLRHLRGHALTAQVPVVMLSADATDSTRTELLLEGAVDYITKPIDLEHLHRILRTHLDVGEEDHSESTSA